MIYLKLFKFPSQEQESKCFNKMTPTYYDSLYPFGFLSSRGLESVELSDITIFAGSNGSGKSTLLNVISERLRLKREAPFNRTELFDNYLDRTEVKLDVPDTMEAMDFRKYSRIITSDDVFNYILETRRLNEQLDWQKGLIQKKRYELRRNPDIRPTGIDFSNPESFDEYSKCNRMLRGSLSDYIRSENIHNRRTYSNGENGYRYFVENIKPNGLYLLDEPENSLSSKIQIELSFFLSGMARRYGCQFIIASHSPFVLATPYAKVYNMDSTPVSCAKWTELENVRTYFEFFEEHRSEF